MVQKLVKRYFCEKKPTTSTTKTTTTTTTPTTTTTAPTSGPGSYNFLHYSSAMFSI